MSTETRLISETAKWQKMAEEAFSKLNLAKKSHPPRARSFLTRSKSIEKGNEFSRNIAAYLSDAKYFSEKKDYVRAFEAVIWAWAWIEIGKEIKVFE